MSRIWEITILPEYLEKRDGRLQRYRLPPSLNGRMHWAARKRIGDAFQRQTMFLCMALRIGRHERIRIEVEQHAIRCSDRDNLASSLKPIIDGIVRAGVVKDDSEEYIDLQFRKSIKAETRKREKLILYVSVI